MQSDGSVKGREKPLMMQVGQPAAQDSQLSPLPTPMKISAC
jgi:hypothetical protein